jgi:hypothetical protein
MGKVGILLKIIKNIALGLRQKFILVLISADDKQLA